jgi:hypothetical protein
MGKLREASPGRLIEHSHLPLLFEAREVRGKIMLHILKEYGTKRTIKHYKTEQPLRKGGIYHGRFESLHVVQVKELIGFRSDTDIYEKILLFRLDIRNTWPKAIQHYTPPNIFEVSEL